MKSVNEINWRGVDLNLLLTFDALYQHRSVSAASKAMHLGQPATSHNLKRLRNLLADPLFERCGHQMSPTRKADQIAPKVRQILAILSQDILPVDEFKPEQYHGLCSIGLSDYAEQIFGPDIFDALQQQAPNAKVLFKPVDTSNCEALIENQQVDCSVGVFDQLSHHIEHQFLYREKHLCLYDQQVLKADSPISLTQYLNTPQIIVTANQQLTTQVDKTLANMNVKRNVVLGTTRFLTVRRMLSQRRLLAVMAEMAGRTQLIEDNLTLCEPPIPIPDFDIELVSLARDSQHPKMIWLKQLVKQVIQSKVAATQQ